MEQIQFKLSVFEGPLSLLLHLISKHKLNIYDIEISLLLDQYFDYINEMKANDLDVASEFLEMAAQLVYIKTLSLLPRQAEEAEELKRELTGRLLELNAIRVAAGWLCERGLFGNIFVREPVSLPVDKTYRRVHKPHELASAFLAAAGKKQRKLPPPRTAFDPIVERRFVPVEEKIASVLKKLYGQGKVAYDEFFDIPDRSEMVATFLALLELIKSRRIRISDNSEYVYFSKD